MTDKHTSLHVHDRPVVRVLLIRGRGIKAESLGLEGFSFIPDCWAVVDVVH